MWMLLLALMAPQEEDGTHLLSRFKGGYRNFNDVWGLHTHDDREVAVIGTQDGTVFVETTDPWNLVELAYIPHASSNWSDMVALDGYVYCANESGGGLQIIDARDLSNIHEVAKRTDWFHTSHNLRLDAETRTLYAPGANTGMPVLDLTVPTAPVLTGNYTAAYVHDLHVQHGMAHLAEIYNGMYRLVDVSTPGVFPTLDSVVTEREFTHNAWASPDDTFVLTSDEKPDGHLGIYDITDPTNVQRLSEFSTGGSATIHNAYMVGDLAHIAYYTEGYVCVDLSDPRRPCKLGQLDTYDGPDEGFDGAWGCYPFQPSGVVYLNDRDKGLHCLVLSTRIDLTPVDDTEDEWGPYDVVATVTPASLAGTIHAVDVLYRVQPEVAFQRVSMTPTVTTDEWSGAIPGQPSGSVVEYFVEVTDDLGVSRQPRREGQCELFAVGRREAVLFDDFEGADDRGWTHGAYANQDDWQRGVPQGKVGDPAFAFSGSQVWGNDLGPEGWNGRYAANVFNWLASPLVDCSNHDGMRLRFRRWLSLDASDRFEVVVNGVTVWESPEDEDVQDEGWATVDVDLSHVDGASEVQLFFLLLTGAIDEAGGMNLDDVELYALDHCALPQRYGTGTAGTGAFVPRIGSDGGAPELGNDQFELTGSSIVGGAACAVFYGVAPAEIESGGLTFLVDLGQFFFTRFAVADGAAGEAGAGTLRQASPIPSDPALADVEAFVQILVLDDGGPSGFAASDGLRLRLCGK